MSKVSDKKTKKNKIWRYFGNKVTLIIFAALTARHVDHKSIGRYS